MARSRPTVFEQIREDGRDAVAGSGLNSSVPLRVVIITVATLAMMSFLPGRLGEISQTAFDRSRIGTTWSQESLVADYPFPVMRNADSVADERARTRAAVPPYVRRINTAEAQAQRRLADAISRISEFATHPEISKRASEALAELYGQGARQIINIDVRQIPTTDVLSIDEQGSEFIVCRHADLRDSASAAEGLDIALAGVDNTLRPKLRQALHAAVVPTLRVDKAVWERQRQLAEQGVSTTREIMRKGDVIVRKGDRVDEAILDGWHLIAMLSMLGRRRSILFWWPSALPDMPWCLSPSSAYISTLFGARRLYATVSWQHCWRCPSPPPDWAGCRSPCRRTSPLSTPSSCRALRCWSQSSTMCEHRSS